MPPTHFNALVLTQSADGQTAAAMQSVPFADLPAGDVLVKISHSSLNYKDGLAVTGVGKVVRRFPMIPGIDFVGTVVESVDARYAVGDAVILTGWGVGENHWGGYAEYARVNGDWLVPLPTTLTPEQAMGIGTAGFTAMMAVMSLEQHGITPASGEIVVTGAAGGAGSIAVALLAALGYPVVASSGREALSDYLRGLGAQSVIGRIGAPERPLGTARWAGGIDGVGGDALANLLSSTRYGGSVAAYGLVGSTGLNTSVLPFILRGVNLLGIDSVMCPQPLRGQVWARLAQDLPLDKLAAMIQVHPLSAVPALATEILAGQVRGRVVIQV